MYFVPLQNHLDLFGEVNISGEGLHILTYVLALMIIKHSKIFNVPYLLWHKATLTSVAERLPVGVSLTVLKTDVCPDWEKNTYLPHTRRTPYNNHGNNILHFLYLSPPIYQSLVFFLPFKITLWVLSSHNVGFRKDDMCGSVLQNKISVHYFWVFVLITFKNIS